jgi:hypothetical protein
VRTPRERENLSSGGGGAGESCLMIHFILLVVGEVYRNDDLYEIHMSVSLSECKIRSHTASEEIHSELLKNVQMNRKLYLGQP